VGLDAVNAGVFAYLYHEYSLGLAAAQFQGQGVLAQPDGSGEPSELRSHAIMSAVARGLMPAPWDPRGSLGARRGTRLGSPTT